MESKFVEELNPRVSSIHYLILKKALEILKINIKENLKNKTNLTMLDVGCGSKPYKELFSPYAKSYIGIDPYKEAKAEICASAEKIPLNDNSIDVVICTQTMEHVRDYKEAINEMHRVLRPGGVVFLATHGTYPIHGAPNDYWRFTKYGLEEVCKKFSTRNVVPMGGIILCLFQIVNLFFGKLSRIFVVGLIFKPIIILNNIIGWNLDKLYYNDIMPVNYLVVANK